MCKLYISWKKIRNQQLSNLGDKNITLTSVSIHELVIIVTTVPEIKAKVLNEKKTKDPPLTRFPKGVFFPGKQSKERRKTIVDNIEE